MTPRPYNSIYLTRDLGATWEKLNFSDIGVTDISYENGTIYAVSYYSAGTKASGAYYSDDHGVTWTYIGRPTSAKKILAYKGVLYYGGSGGLWLSRDKGTTWEVQIPGQVYSLAAHEGTVFVGLLTSTYRSVDNGHAWQKLEHLNGITVDSFAGYNNILMGSTRNLGIYISTDYGATWHILESLKDQYVRQVAALNNKFFAARQIGNSISYEILVSTDYGNSWQYTGVSTERFVMDMAAFHGEQEKILAIDQYNGVYASDIPSFVETKPLLAIPWQYQDENELITRITAYFDHQYPLLGYWRYPEPSIYKETTLNYLGNEDKEPYLYYSSHDGTDFWLPYGTPITAAASGWAEYFTCGGCGHSIRIKHPSGYETIYMHFQNEGLVTTSSIPLWVNEGEQIGVVGMTGNTTGPHLHFAVIKDQDPDGRVDPFGWQGSALADPWWGHTWTDSLGTHTGAKSIYLWKVYPQEIRDYINSTIKTVEFQNKKVTIQTDESLTVIIKPYIMPILYKYQNNLAYVFNTSFVINLVDYLGKTKDTLAKAATLEIALPAEIIDKFVRDTLKINFFSETTNTWEELPTILDEAASTVRAQTTHFSKFAVFGKKLVTPPETTHTLEGATEKGWFTTYPVLSLATSDPTDTIFFATENEVWHTYTQPVTLEKEGKYTLSYRAMDTAENIESVKTIIVRTDTQGVFKKTLKIVNSEFNLQ